MGVAVLTRDQVIAGLQAKLRRGWVIRGIPEPICETVWDHTKKSVYTVRRAAPHFGVHVKRAVGMAFVHDLTEFIEEDWTPYCPDKPSKEEKHRRERLAMRAIAPAFGMHAGYLIDCFDEFQENSTPTAQLVNQLEKADFAIAGLDYEKMGFHVDTPPLYEEIRTKIHHPLLLDIYDRTLEKHRGTRGENSAYFDYFRMLKAGRTF